jgi:uncharacterized membrane protein
MESPPSQDERRSVARDARRAGWDHQHTSFATARARVVASAVAGLVGGAAAAPVAPWQVSVLIGWVVAAALFTGRVWVGIGVADPARTAEIATREDNSRVAADFMLLSASVASLVGVGFALIKASSEKGAEQPLITVLTVLSVVLAWLTVHTVFTLRYARLYFDVGGGIDFHHDDAPDYRDFAYVAFTVGMTYQVSDTDLTAKTIRRAALGHALLSFLFGTAIVAMMINVVAGLLNK